MRLTTMGNIMLWIKKVLFISDKKPYLSKLIDNIEQQNAEGKNIPFKIVDIREKGFIVKVGGLFGYVSFNHMPWRYNNIGAWQAVFPYLTGKILFCKIYKLQKDPLLIIINGAIPQFRDPELFENNQYKGIVIKKSNMGVFVDIGYHFMWQFGSIVGFLHKLNFEHDKIFDKVKKGDLTGLFYFGCNQKGELLFGSNPELKEWVTREIDELIGETLPVSIVKSYRGNLMCTVKNKYNATLPVTDSLYHGNKPKVKKAIGNLREGDIIHCEIIKINRNRKDMILRWDSIPEIEGLISRSAGPLSPTHHKSSHRPIQSRTGEEASDQAAFVGKTVKVEAFWKEDSFGRSRIKYRVENKFQGRLIIANDTYQISNKEKKQIEKNLQDGEVLYCTVLSVDKDIINVKWTLKDEEFYRYVDE